MTGKTDQIVEHLFRAEYGKLVATLTSIFGTANIQLAEDVVQETLITALGNWGTKGIPDNPTAWLVQVAKRKALNELKRNQMVRKHHQADPIGMGGSHYGDPVFLENEIEDSQLRMIFTCCHPLLNVESQIALTLKTLCGFGVGEVARALLTTESTINKRLYRAKKSIRDSNLPFSIPQGAELEKRLKAVGLALYLLFNEGYNSTSKDSIIQKELCLEAIRLVKLLLLHFDNNQELCALLALMCFHTARFEARIDNHGAIVLFADQDRALWNKELIVIGMKYMQKSMGAKRLSAYHIEAGIAAEHCMAESFETTNWQSIYDQYKLLEKLKPNPVIALNLAVIQSQLEGIESSLRSLDKLKNDAALSHYHLLPATQGIFHMKLGNFRKAIAHLEAALRLEPSATESSLIQNRIEECKKML